MERKNSNNSENQIEVESEIFAIVNTILNLYTKYQEGTINDNFFQKTIKNSVNGLLKLKLYLKNNKISLPELLGKMNYIEEYNKAIKIINDISSLDFTSHINGSNSGKSSHLSRKISSSILELPGVTSEITSSFITLMDALKLSGFNNKDIIIKLFKELKHNLKKFPGLEDIKYKIEKIHKNVINNVEDLVKSNKFRETIGDDLYAVYKEFQNLLNLDM